ncbi:hypothetical protein [Nitrosomonas nitrosa]|uniref:hypothetical protein n=1 Tax=Nitrosomonas nitrosa TaxID=52442 RepID=UPI0011B2218D|nr:hypothetical protein [Nitrosomonas nitrosa]
MRLWVEPNEHLARGTIEPGSDVNLMIGVEPADASNQVQLSYRVNGGHVTNIAAEPVRHVGDTQYFKACLPCSTLRDGDLVEYSAVCQCAGRQVPSAHEAEQFASSFRVMSTSAMGAQAPSSNDRENVKSISVASSSGDPRIHTAISGTYKLKQTHLSLFAVDQKTGHPIARIPFYAEVGVVAYVPSPKLECKLKETIKDSYKKFLYRSSSNPERYSRDIQVPDAFTDPLCDVLSSLLSPETIDALVGDSNKVSDLITGIFTKAKEINKNNEISSNDPEASRQILEAAIRAYVKEHNDLHLADQNAQLQKIVWAHPMGVLATDHAGYLSFDLTRLPPDVASAVASALEARRRNPNITTETSIWLYPMAQEEKCIDALEQVRFAHDAIVARIELDVELDPVLCQPKVCEFVKNLGIAAMQNPSLTDWRLSPASFATNPSTLLGEDGCESLLPANIALQEFYFYQIVGLSDIHPNDLPPETQGKVKFGVAHEYRVAWYPLGHSLGQIQYSLPLAPGESVNLAVIDWTRRDVGSRAEDTSASEQLVHNQRRDRTITETVNAAIKEYQEGSSFMAGAALSTGIAGTLGMFGVAAGLAGSLGGSNSDSQGSRDIAASTVQKLSDNITQSSASMRELQSTVVVQTTQHEKETIETRTVVNY